MNCQPPPISSAAKSLTDGYLVLDASWHDDVAVFSLWIDKLGANISRTPDRLSHPERTFSKFGFTNRNHCLMTPSTLLPRHSTSLKIRRDRHVSASASQKTYGSVNTSSELVECKTTPIPSCREVPGLSHHTTRRCPRRSRHEASIWKSSFPSADASRTSRWVFRRAFCGTMR